MMTDDSEIAPQFEAVAKLRVTERAFTESALRYKQVADAAYKSIVSKTTPLTDEERRQFAEEADGLESVARMVIERVIAEWDKSVPVTIDPACREHVGLVEAQADILRSREAAMRTAASMMRSYHEIRHRVGNQATDG